jgi:hypothetical protein
MTRWTTMFTLALTFGLLVACSATPMRRNVKELWRDGSIKSDLKVAMTKDDRVQSRHMNLDVFRGVVTLSGRVESPDQRAIAVKIAQRTPGVVMVEDHLVARTAHDPRFTPPLGARDHPARIVEAPVVRDIDRAAYSDLAIGDPYVDSAPRPFQRRPVRQEQRIVSRPAQRSEAYSDLAVGDPLSHARWRRPQKKVRVTKKPKAPGTPAAKSARVPAPAPAQVDARPVDAHPVITPRPANYVEKGVLPPAGQLTRGNVATREPQRSSGSSDLAQEAAAELRRLKDISQ